MTSIEDTVAPSKTISMILRWREKERRDIANAPLLQLQGPKIKRSKFFEDTVNERDKLSNTILTLKSIKKAVLFKPFIFEDSNAKNEVKKEVSALQRKIAKLKNDLSRAERKLVALTTITKRIHSIIESLLSQHKIVTKLIKGFKATEKVNYFITDNMTLLKSIIKTGNHAQEDFSQPFSVLASLMFSYETNNEPTRESKS